MAVLATISRDTQKGFSGICKFLIASTNDVSVGYDVSSGEVSFVSDSSLPTVFFSWTPTKETSSFSSPLTGNPQAGTAVFLHTVNMVFARTETVKRNQLQVAAKDQELIVVAIERNGQAWCLGGVDSCSSGLDATGGDFLSGAAGGDQNGMLLTLTGNFGYPPGIVTDASLAELQ